MGVAIGVGAAVLVAAVVVVWYWRRTRTRAPTWAGPGREPGPEPVADTAKRTTLWGWRKHELDGEGLKELSAEREPAPVELCAGPPESRHHWS